jgi:antirestriction protein ArdC
MKIEWQAMLNEVLNVQGSLSNTYNRFYNYSLMNRMLIMMQGVNEPVATYKKWQELGRQVRKDEKAKFIVRPIFYKDKKNKKEDAILGGFKMVNSIFGYSSTDGPEIDFETPEWSKTKALAELGITLTGFNSTDGNAQGYATIEKQIAINPVAKYPQKVLFHEIAHIIMGHCGDPERNSGIKEFQAETTAYICMKELGLDGFNPDESRAYVQNWLGKNKPTDEEIKQVFKAVDTIINAGMDTEEDN